ncbi:PREDICTED: uncharacterized protein LOC109332492 [Lupinus angustifolius]|uniref:uncharacterized protein LOC109332492 n=1 Tax=Lupinus angustifolius TaxID=3871 RepID=UPI00092FD260|nr:PREDICTED: uncharacterized protein LOC109332492 [Lupinus angustifolius]
MASNMIILNPINDPSNLYYMHPSENLASVLVTPPLSGTNYHSWSMEMMMALKYKNKLQFIDGTLPKPRNDDPSFGSWDRCNTLVLSWINHSIERSVLQSILWMDTTFEVWEDLKERYYQGDVFRICDLHEEIHSAKQGNRCINAYHTHLKGLWQELENFRPLPSCLCPTKCNSALANLVRNYREDDYVIRFLKASNKGRIRERTFPTSGNNGMGKGNGGRGRGSSFKLCSFCNKSRHTVDSCYKKHGFSPNYKKNHNINFINSEDDNQNNHLGVFTTEQHKAILALLKQPANSQVTNQITNTETSDPGNPITLIFPIKPKDWVLDTGATDHVCFSLSEFQSFIKIDHIQIRLPNGSKVVSSIAGTVIFSKDLCLSNVLCIPKFSFNLISVSKLTTTLNCKLTFTNTKCVMQEESTLRMIGAAEAIR